jgi:hypothetical protein
MQRAKIYGEGKTASVHAMKSYRGSRGVAPLLNLGCFALRDIIPVPIEQEAGWVPEPE